MNAQTENEWKESIGAKNYNICAQRIHSSLETFFARLAHVLEQGALNNALTGFETLVGLRLNLYRFEICMGLDENE